MKHETGLSTLSLAILGLISQRPLSGYDIRRVFQTTPMGHFSSSPGAIYPALNRIEATGWIRPAAGGGGTGRQRTVYEVTPQGLEALRRHLSRPVTRDDIIWRMDDLMLRFAFMDGIVGREAALQFLCDFASHIEAHVAGLRQFADTMRDAMPPCGRLALNNGIESYDMNARWARRAIEELKSQA